MINEQFSTWVKSTFNTISYQGNPSTKTFKFHGNKVKDAELFDLVMDTYKAERKNHTVDDFDGVLLYSKGSDDEAAIKAVLYANAKANKSAHAVHEKQRREADVAGSPGDKKTMMPVTPTKLSDVDLKIISHFRVVTQGSTREMYHIADDGVMEYLGTISDKPEARSALAELMCERRPIDIANEYQTISNLISSEYNTMQAFTSDEIENAMVAANMIAWEEIKALTKPYRLDSVVMAEIAHYQKHTLPVLPWALHDIELYKVESTSIDDHGTSYSWLSGFKFYTKQGILMDSKMYYSLALNQTQYFTKMDRPARFGGIFKLRMDDEGNVVKPSGIVAKNWTDNPILKAIYSGMSVNQIKASTAFDYCVVHQLTTPSQAQVDNGGNCKNTHMDIIAEGCAEMWGCPTDEVIFKIERDQLANQERKYHVKSEGLRKRTMLDALNVFVDEFSPSNEFWEEFKSLTGAKEAKLNVRPLYSDPYMVKGKPVPFFMARNRYTRFYEKDSMWRRLFVIRTTTKNSFLALSDEEKKMFDDPDVRKSAFATIMFMGEMAYNEIESKGGMLAINDVFPEIGKVLSAAADDDNKEMEKFYITLLEDNPKAYVEDKSRYEIPYTTIEKAYMKFFNKDADKSDQMRIAEYMLGKHNDNFKDRPQRKGKREVIYFMYSDFIEKSATDEVVP